MAGERKIVVTFDGKDAGLEKVADRAADSLDGLDESSRRAGDGLDAMGETAGTVDTRAMGFRDTITGVQDTMGGWNQLMEGDVAGGMFTLGAGIGDLASGMENLIIPIVKSGVTWVSTHATMAASSIASAASAVVSWISMAAASVVNAAIVAASWLLAFAPVIIVAAIVIGLVILIIKNWDTIKDVIKKGWEFVKRITSAVWDGIKSAISAVVSAIATLVRTWFNTYKSIIQTAWNTIKTITTTAFNTYKSIITKVFTTIANFITGKIDSITSGFRRFKNTVASIFRGVGSAITSPIKSALNGIKSIWNNSIGGKGISIPSFLGFGGIDFTIPKLHSGGIFRAPGGQSEGLALLSDGERVSTPAQQAAAARGGNAAGSTVIEIRSGGSEMDDLLVAILRKAIRNRGGSVENVLGGF